MMQTPPSSGASRFGQNLRPTKAVLWLLIIHGVVFVSELVIGRFPGGEEFLLTHLSLSYDRFLQGEFWQPVSYMFLHDPYGISHILFNMLMLWMFGTPLEGFWGSRRFLWFYLLTAVLAAAAILLVAWVAPSQRLAPTLGASGALYALLVAFGFNFPKVKVFLFGLFPIQGKHLVLLFIGVGLLQALTLSVSQVSLAAHVGGMTAGFFLVTGAWRPKRISVFCRDLLRRVIR